MPNPPGQDFVTIENYAGYTIYARLTNVDNNDEDLKKIENNFSYTWHRKLGKKFLAQIERVAEIKNGPVFKLLVGNNYEFDEKSDVYDIKNDYYLPLSEYDFDDRIKGEKRLKIEQEMAETHYKFVFFNYSYRDFNVTFNGKTKLIKKLNNEAFYSEEKKENQKLLVSHACPKLDLRFEYNTVKNFFSYTLDSAFNLFQNNSEELIKEDYVNVSYEEYVKIIEEGNKGIF